jgi:CelD/BcsL family acetyltransferase involved in cellulose biosynthesis
VQTLCRPAPFCAPANSDSGQASDFTIRLVPGKELRTYELEIWRDMQQSNSELGNPCFSAEFVQAVAAVRGDVEIAVIHDAQNRPVAFLPFQRKSRFRAVPAGGIVSDYQALICQPGFQFDPKLILKACNLVAWDFDRLLVSQNSFAPYHRLSEPSAQIDLSDGFDAYASQRRQAGTRQLRYCQYMTRRMERELGPLRFVTHSSEPELLHRVLGWKSDQYRRSGWNDLFATDWAPGMLERIQAIQKPSFAGMLSLLYAGPHLVAGHMGMRSQTVWHYWFPAYDRRFSKYSPGLILLLRMMQSAEVLGLRSIDIGTGLSLYKKRLMNATVQVAEGSVETGSCLNLFRMGRRVLRHLARSAGYRH